MTHYLKTKDDKVIIFCDVRRSKLYSDVNIIEYSKLLLNERKKDSFMKDIDVLDEIAAEWDQETESGWKSIDEFVSYKYNKIAKRWDLDYSKK